MGLGRETGLVVGCLAAFGCGGPGPIRSSFERADAAGVDATATTEDGGNCSFLVEEFTVFVTDQRTGDAICDATVVAQGPVSLSFEAEGSEASCYFVQSRQPIAAGSYTVDVTAPGYESAQRTNLLVTTDACGYSAPTVTVALLPVATAMDASIDEDAADAANDGPPDAGGAD